MRCHRVPACHCVGGYTLTISPSLFPFPSLLPSGPPSPVSSFPGHDHWGGTPLLDHGRAAATSKIGARQCLLCLSSCSPLPASCAAKTSHPASHPHNTLAYAITLHSHLLPAHTAPPHCHLYFGYKLPVPSAPLGFVSAAATDRATLHIHSAHSINTRKHPSPTRLGQVYKRALVVPPFFPYQRAFVCGACAGTVQIGVSLVTLLDPLFKRSRLHSLDVCLK